MPAKLSSIVVGLPTSPTELLVVNTVLSTYLGRLRGKALEINCDHLDEADFKESQNHVSSNLDYLIFKAWDSSSRNNMADVRELIPEFFYLPDFLENRNRFDIGTKQNGESLDDVLLPPWAKNCPGRSSFCGQLA